jgi:Flp pilus assembly protein TadG
MRAACTQSRQSGSLILELAIVLPFLLLLALGVPDFGHILKEKLMITEAAFVAGKAAAIQPSGAIDVSEIIRQSALKFITNSNQDSSLYEVKYRAITLNVTSTDGTATTVSAVQIDVQRTQTNSFWAPSGFVPCAKSIVHLAEGNITTNDSPKADMKC